MDIKDVNYIEILDSTGQHVFYSLNYSDLVPLELLSTISHETEPISVFNDHLLLLSRQNDITVVLLASLNSNEIFVKGAFDALIEALSKIIKKWGVERISEKYDQIVLTMNEFVFHGVILTDNAAELGNRVMKRTFENIGGIKVTKGLASFINKATKTLRS